MGSSTDFAATGYVPSPLDVALDPTGVAEWATLVTPGSAVVKPLALIDPRQVGQSGRVDAVAALERQIAWLQAAQLSMIAALATAESANATDRPQRDWVREELGCALRLSAASAADRLELARELTERLPITFAALHRGAITVLHARFLVEQTRMLDSRTASAIEDRVIGRAAEQTLAQFRASVRRARSAADTAAGEERHRRAAEQRRVEITPDDDGMSHLYAYLPAEGAAKIAAALDCLAARRGDDARSADQRRADALVALAGGAAASCCSHPPVAERGGAGMNGARPSIQVTVALSTLLGLDDDPADLDRHGPVPASVARRIAADPTGSWRRLVVDDAGRLLDVGRRSYRPPADLARHVRARDRTCAFPGCRRSAARCELDHVRPWNRDGTTCETNLHCLCSRHHHAKHDRGWRPVRAADGSTIWTSPTGHRYRRAPAIYPIAASGTGNDRGRSELGAQAGPDPPPL